ncbi:MAG: hypothetical protein PSX71_00090 [bacterium]|nr:hypothetical protein [bacterium]
MTDPENNITNNSANTRLYLRACIKILATIGFVFLLVPFFKSLPWPHDGIPVDSVLLRQAELAEGSTRRIRLPGDTMVFVTRNSPALQAALAAFDPDNLWFTSAPGLTGQRYFVVRATSMQDEVLRYLPPKAAWPGGFVADSGAAWDVAGRALKPWPGHPSGYRVKIQNLLPMPFKARGDDVLLIPPADVPVPAPEENP